jgi:putative FmdB family regulatory protein
MPLYSYECGKCGPLEIQVPMSQCDTAIACPICAYNAYVDATEVGILDFYSWMEQEWQKLKGDNAGQHQLRRVLDAPLFVVR